MCHGEYPNERQTPAPLLYPLRFFISARESPQIPLHLAFWSLHWLQLTECLYSRLHVAFTPCAAGEAHGTHRQNEEEAILNFRARLTLLSQVLWENCLTRKTNPLAFRGRELTLQQVIASSLFPNNWSVLTSLLLKKKYSEGALLYGISFRKQNHNPSVACTSQKQQSRRETEDTQLWPSSSEWCKNFDSFGKVFKGWYLPPSTSILSLARGSSI